MEVPELRPARRASLGGWLSCDMLSSLFSLGFSRRFEVFVGLVRYRLERKGYTPQRGIYECQRFLNFGQVDFLR
jgi:hypothetical protein